MSLRPWQISSLAILTRDKIVANQDAGKAKFTATRILNRPDNRALNITNEQIDYSQNRLGPKNEAS